MSLSTHEHLDHQRWLINNGFINDLHKDTLYMYGAIVHKDVKAVEVRIDIAKKIVEYDVYVAKQVLNALKLHDKLQRSGSIISLWRLKRLLTKEGNLNFMSMLTRFVKDYCGPKWEVKLDVRDVKKYEDGFKKAKANETSTNNVDGGFDLQSNK